jgi:hypothetical protein
MHGMDANVLKGETMTPNEQATGGMLRRVQALPTSGARAAEIFADHGATFLAIPQLAYDVPDAAAHMNGGDSDTELLILRWDGTEFMESVRLPAPGGEDAEHFIIDGTAYIATASARSGKGPYEPNIVSTIYRQGADGWEVFQQIPTFFAKQWRHFTIDGRHFLALAQGVTIETAVPTNPRASAIYVWNEGRFEPFQVIEGLWGYNFHHFEVNDRHFLAYADHVGPSGLLAWTGSGFEPFQTFSDKGGRAFTTMWIDGQLQLAFANIHGPSVVYRWDGASFAELQQFSGSGGREFAYRVIGGIPYLVLVNFIEGTPQAPRTDLLSHIYSWTGDTWSLVESFPTFGATDAAFFESSGDLYLVVTNSLTTNVRFRQDAIVYAVDI